MANHTQSFPEILGIFSIWPDFSRINWQFCESLSLRFLPKYASSADPTFEDSEIVLNDFDDELKISNKLPIRDLI